MRRNAPGLWLGFVAVASLAVAARGEGDICASGAQKEKRAAGNETKNVRKTTDGRVAGATASGQARTTRQARHFPKLAAPASSSADRSLDTSLSWARSVNEAAEQAEADGKLVFVIHVSGDFEQPEFT